MTTQIDTMLKNLAQRYYTYEIIDRLEVSEGIAFGCFGRMLCCHMLGARVTQSNPACTDSWTQQHYHPANEKPLKAARILRSVVLVMLNLNLYPVVCVCSYPP